MRDWATCRRKHAVHRIDFFSCEQTKSSTDEIEERFFVYLVLHGALIIATCCSTIFYPSLLASCPIGVCNSLSEPLVFFLSSSLLFTSKKKFRCKQKETRASRHNSLPDLLIVFFATYAQLPKRNSSTIHRMDRNSGAHGLTKRVVFLHNHSSSKISSAEN